jgi:outer membrane protein insertion porin family
LAHISTLRSVIAWRTSRFTIPVGASPQIEAEKGSTSKSEIQTSLVFDRRDNPLLTRTGQRVSLSPYVAGGFLGGDEQVYGFDLEGSQYFHFPWDTILLLNAEIATIDVWDQPEFTTVLTSADPNPSPPPNFVNKMFTTVPTVPIFDRLFLGGANNLRGFNFRDVSPKDRFGEPLGGQSMARATVEFTFPIVAKTRGAFFYDTGLVNPDSWDFKERTLRTIRASPGHPNRKTIFYDNLASDFGVGVRLDLPIGPLRLDYGIPIETAGNSSQGQFNFSVGYQF